MSRDPIAFEVDKDAPVAGRVLFSKGRGWLRPTGVFLPPRFSSRYSKLTVLLWLHGFYVPDLRHLFFAERTKILKATLDSEGDLILVAPHLGYYQNEDNSSYAGSALGGGMAERYLDQVLDVLHEWHAASLIDLGDPPPRFRVANLVVAGHSAGGGAMRAAVGGLGRYRDALRECWGFDCLYGSSSAWYEWAQKLGYSNRSSYFYYGRGTRPADKADVLGFWKHVYGSPKAPMPSWEWRLSRIGLAPALPGAEHDPVAFQSAEELRKKGKAANPYEVARGKVDPLVDNAAEYWKILGREGLKGHYEVVSDLLAPRLRQSLAKFR